MDGDFVKPIRYALVSLGHISGIPAERRHNGMKLWLLTIGLTLCMCVGILLRGWPFKSIVTLGRVKYCGCSTVF